MQVHPKRLLQFVIEGYSQFDLQCLRWNTLPPLPPLNPPLPRDLAPATEKKDEMCILS